MEKKASSLILVLMAILLCMSMIACQPSTEQPPENEKPPVNTPPDESDPNVRLPIDYLPEVTYNGAQFHIMQWGANGAHQAGSGWIPWEEGDVEDLDGSLLGEAVFNRNALVEERYDVEITAEYADVADEYFMRMDFNNSSGDDLYQLVTMRSNDLARLITNDFMLDLKSWEQYIHTDMPWWVQDSVESYTLGEHLYMASSEILLRDKGATAVMVFDQQIATDNEITDLYELARTGAWTLDEMLIDAETAARDEDGSTMMDSADDIWGMSGSYDIITMMYNALGWKFARPNEDGHLQAEFGDNSRSIIDLQDLVEQVADADWYYSNADKATFNPEGRSITALFSGGMVSGLRRRSENPQGILPLPKLNVLQEDYSSLVWMHYDSALGIPVAVADPEMCAVILEALSWEAYYTVSPVFYDDILLNRGAQDSESKEMLQIILKTRSYDPGQFWGRSSGLFSTATGVIATALTSGADTISSSWATSGDAFKESLREINDIIDSREE